MPTLFQVWRSTPPAVCFLSPKGLATTNSLHVHHQKSSHQPTDKATSSSSLLPIPYYSEIPILARLLLLWFASIPSSTDPTPHVHSPWFLPGHTLCWRPLYPRLFNFFFLAFLAKLYPWQSASIQPLEILGPGNQSCSSLLVQNHFIGLLMGGPHVESFNRKNIWKISSETMISFESSFPVPNEKWVYPKGGTGFAFFSQFPKSVTWDKAIIVVVVGK